MLPCPRGAVLLLDQYFGAVEQLVVLQKLCVREENRRLFRTEAIFHLLIIVLQGLMGIHHRRIKGNQFGSRIGLLILDHNFFRGVLSDRAVHYAIGGRHATGKRGRAFGFPQQTLAIQHHRRCFLMLVTFAQAAFDCRFERGQCLLRIRALRGNLDPSAVDHAQLQ